MSASTTLVTIEPAALDRSAAARFIALSESTLETLSRTESLLKPVQVSKGRVAWPVANLRQYIQTRPVADLPPPAGSGYGRAGRPSSKAASLPSQATLSAS